MKNPSSAVKENAPVVPSDPSEESTIEKPEVDELDEPSAKRVKEDDKPYDIDEIVMDKETDEMDVDAPAEAKENDDLKVETSSEFSMDDAEALKWKSYFLSACRWFDVSQDQELRFDQLQMILLSSQRYISIYVTKYR